MNAGRQAALLSACEENVTWRSAA